MADYCSNLTLSEVARRLSGAQRVWVTAHAKPDGDAFGAVVALAAALTELGKEVRAFFAPPVPACFGLLRGAELTEVYAARAQQRAPGAESQSLAGPVLNPEPSRLPPDFVVILDTGAWSQLAPMRDLLTPHLARTLIIDHHLSGDVPAAWRYIDAHAAASCELVAAAIDELAALPQPLAPRGAADLCTPSVCEALYVGIASDTGWFRFSNTHPGTLELAARLLRAGVDHADLYQKLEQAERPQKLALLVRALDSLTLLAGGRVALMVLRASDFTQTGASLDETERFVDVPQMVGSVQVVALVTEGPAEKSEERRAKSEERVGPAVPAAAPDPQPAARAPQPPLIRLSFRSKPGPAAVNVADLARQYGGGGHARAAGAKVAAALPATVAELQAKLTALFP